jgi:pyruvate/2-oxoglutarate dehydrogenase complex dihydrolipoamide dehydrogenase (E3) component
VFRKPLTEVDRYILEGETVGFVKIIVKEGSDEVIGATIVGEGAGDLISEVCMAVVLLLYGTLCLRRTTLFHALQCTALNSRD